MPKYIYSKGFIEWFLCTMHCSKCADDSNIQSSQNLCSLGVCILIWKTDKKQIVNLIRQRKVLWRKIKQDGGADSEDTKPCGVGCWKPVLVPSVYWFVRWVRAISWKADVVCNGESVCRNIEGWVFPTYGKALKKILHMGKISMRFSNAL